MVEETGKWSIKNMSSVIMRAIEKIYFLLPNYKSPDGCCHGFTVPPVYQCFPPSSCFVPFYLPAWPDLIKADVKVKVKRLFKHQTLYFFSSHWLKTGKKNTEDASVTRDSRVMPGKVFRPQEAEVEDCSGGWTNWTRPWSDRRDVHVKEHFSVSLFYSVIWEFHI